MFISRIFKKIIWTSSKKEVVRVCIENLQIDQTQKNLFLGSLDFLDEEWLELLYAKITGFLEEIMERKNLQRSEHSKEEQMRIHTKEYNENLKEKNSFKILLDTI